MTVAPARELPAQRKVEYARVNHTLPCGRCKYPLVPCDRGRCPRCAAGKNWRVI